MNGSDLRRRREKLSLSQSQIAEKLAVSANTVARWERGEMALPAYLDLALQTIERLLAQSHKANSDLPSYVREAMNQDGLTFRVVSDRAKQQGFQISQSAVMGVVQGRVENPSLKLIKALAAGLNRPVQDLMETAGINIGSKAEGKGEIYISLLESPRFTDMASNYERLTSQQKQDAEPMVAQLESWIKSKLPNDH